jgi:hypothetical protein
MKKEFEGENLDKLFQEGLEALGKHALQLWNLQRVLLKLQDRNLGCYLDLATQEPLMQVFWTVSGSVIRDQIVSPPF